MKKLLSVLLISLICISAFPLSVFTSSEKSEAICINGNSQDGFATSDAVSFQQKTPFNKFITKISKLIIKIVLQNKSAFTKISDFYKSVFAQLKQNNLNII